MRPLGLQVLLLCVLASIPAAASAQPASSSSSSRPGAWGNAAGVDPCGSESLLEQAMARDPELRRRRELAEALAREAQRLGLIPEGASRPGATTLSGPQYVIPVAVHIVHQGGAENISDNQVLSQIAALNRDSQNLPPLPSALDTKIKFCLAQNLPPASPVMWSTTPGITRTNSPETNHTYGSLASENALKAIDYLPADRYLNIWVVKTIAGGGGGVAGYGTFPGAGPLSRDGIVMRYDVFGSNTTGFGTFALLPSNPDGKILTHEAGHYLNLYHPFHGGCTPPGDNVSDTPPEAVNNVGCPVSPPTSCTAAPDPIYNYMDYTNDACRYQFTSGQTTRMQSAITTWRSLLVSAGNLIYTGCPSGLNALITVTPSQVCAGSPVQFSTPASNPNYVYSWSFPGGTPSSGATQTVNVTYPAAGTMNATLTVTDTTNGNFSTNTQTVYVVACTPIAGHCTNWVFSSGAALSFATGVPVAFGGTQNTFGEPAAAMSNATGSLLFYTNADVVWSANNNVMPNGTGLQGGISTHNGAIAIPRPGSSTQYLLFIVSQSENGYVANPATWNVIDMTLNGGNGDIVAGQKNLPINLLPAGNKRILEGQTLIPHCNGTDWWLIHHGAETTSNLVWVTLVTSAGPVSTTSYNIGINAANAPGSITASRDGTRFAAISFFPSRLGVFNFNRATGVPTVLMAPTGVGDPYIDVSFSPDGKLLYFATYDYASTYGVRQLEIATGLQRDIVTNVRGDVELGPDGKVYLGQAGSPTIHTINFPNNFNTANANECGLNLNSVSLGGAADGIFGALPNTPQQCTNGAQPAQFTWSVTNCTQVSFQALNCAGPYNWNFGDANFATGQIVSHNYALPGVYNVTLTVPGASPSTVTQTLNLTAAAVSIAGPAPTCSTPSNYSAVGPANYLYQWTITGGAPASASGNNVDVVWGPTGGTVVLTATDPVTGCVATASKPVGWCPTCVKPPLGMTAWWPLDEPAGAIAREIVAGNDGADINAPPHPPGKVLRGRQFSYTGTTHVRVNDESRLNFGTGDFTIDAWIKTSSLEEPLPIVDKRSFGPERGYALFLRMGRLVLRIGDGVTGTEYVVPSPLVNDGVWHHVAAVQKRGSTGGIKMFIDGAPAGPTFPALTAAVNLTNPERLLIGGLLPSSLAPSFAFEGLIDEVELFNRALTPSQIAGIAGADTMGKCKEYCLVPWGTVICRDQQFVTITMTICNLTTAPQTYNLNFSGLPAGSPGIGVGCTTNGPSTFQVLSPATPVAVPANSCVPVQVKITRPPGMPIGSSACFQATITNTVSGAQYASHGSLYANWRCNVVIGPPVTDVTVGGTASLRFRVTNDDETPVSIGYQAVAIPGSPDDPPAVSLAGLPPGEPYLGTLTIAEHDSAEIEIPATFLEPQVFRCYDIALGLDADGDGTTDGYASAALRYVDHITQPIGVVSPAPTQLALLPVSPNPVRGIGLVSFELPRRDVVRLALYDVSGRRIRTLIDGVREAGRTTARIDSRGLKTGVYFLRLEAGNGSAMRRVVMIR